MSSVPDREAFFTFVLNKDMSISVSLNSSFLIVLVVIFCILIVLLVVRMYASDWRSLEIDEAEFGIGNQKYKLRPNRLDKQIAYKIWVELSTRKIGLDIDLEDDVIIEIYDSWYNFFSVTRELIKDMPSSKFRRKDTKRIIRLSIEVLNQGIRPNLTTWQARFRRWYDRELSSSEKVELAPQELQQNYPKYAALAEDLLRVNKRLIRYREKMYQIIEGTSAIDPSQT